MPTSCIYAITSGESVWYVGRTIDLDKRWGAHLSALKYGKGRNRLLQWVYNRSAVRVKVLEHLACPRSIDWNDPKHRAMVQREIDWRRMHPLAWDGGREGREDYLWPERNTPNGWIDQGEWRCEPMYVTHEMMATRRERAGSVLR